MKYPASIKEFEESYSWLSNSAPCKIYLDGLEYPSVENAYQSAKSKNPQWKIHCVKASPNEVNVKDRKIDVVPSWNFMKISVMKYCRQQKFNEEPYRRNLLATGINAVIINGNHRGDTFWGFDLNKNEGENLLGKMIMDIRTNLYIEEHKKKPPIPPRGLSRKQKKTFSNGK